MNEAEKRVVIVTGAGQGVGQGIALAFAKTGFTVVLTGRTLEKLNTTKVTGTETQFAGFGLKVVTKVAGIGALQKAKKKELFESYNLK